jgi:protein phosphatase
VTSLRAGAATDIGLVRATNQDRHLVAADLAVVADGMGGHAAGEVAAATAVEGLRRSFESAPRRSAAALLDAAREANRSVWEAGQQDRALRGMGTTLVAVALVEPDEGLEHIDDGPDDHPDDRAGDAPPAEDRATVDADDAGPAKEEPAKEEPAKEEPAGDTGGDRPDAVAGAREGDEAGDAGGSSPDRPPARLAVVNVGDSRVYQLQEGSLHQLTVDHSLVAELVAEGRLAEEEAEFHPHRHVLTRALGVDPEVEVDLVVLDVTAGDRILLCSDGLSREVSDLQLASVLRRLADPGEAARELVTEARLRGGNDNITVVVVDVVDERDPASTAPGPEDEVLGKPPADGGGPDRPAGAEGGRDEGGGRARVGWWRRWKPRRAALRRGRAPIVTPRVVLFFAALVAVLAVAAGGVAWYARAGYFVGLEGDRITIFQGRPGGVLWFRPTVAEQTGLTTGQVVSRHLPTLQAGQEEASLSAARRYVDNLRQEMLAAQAQHLPGASPVSGVTTPGGTTTP